MCIPFFFNDAAIKMFLRGQGAGARFSKVPRTFRARKASCQTAIRSCFEKLIFLHVFNIRKTKRIAKFDGLEPRRCEDIKGIVAPEIDPKSFWTFEKRAPGQ